MKKVIVGSHVERVSDYYFDGQEIEVELHDQAVVTGITYVKPYIIVQYWRPADAR